MAVRRMESATKLSTLQENLENVSLDVDTRPLRVIKRSSSQNFATLSAAKGLGITTLPRRPSDNAVFKTIQNKNSTSKVSLMERPVSNDSITSTTTISDFSEEVNSRTSSLTSGSVGCSPTLQHHLNGSTSSLIESKLNPTHQMAMKNASQLSVHRLRESTSTPKLNSFASSHSQLSIITSTHSSNPSTSTVNTLTPSQKFRLRRQNSKSSSKATIREREKYFDEVNSDDETFQDGLIWNVPFTKGPATLFAPSSGTSPALIKSIMDDSPAMLPMSPLPGSSAPSSPLANSQSFYLHQDEAHSISKFYEQSSENFAKRELLNRQLSSSNLPVTVKEASSLGLDDMKLISKEKADSLSSTRPIWLPPKPVEESKKHERDIHKMLEKAAKLDKKKQEEHDQHEAMKEANRKRWAELEERGVMRNSTQYEMKKLCYKTAIPDHLRYYIWSQVMSSRASKSKTMSYEKYDELKAKLDQIPELPSSKTDEIDRTVSKLFVKLGCFQTGQPLNEKLCRLIKMKMISAAGVEDGDEMMLAILLLKFNEVDAHNLNNWLRQTVFDDVSRTKFNNNLSKNTVMKKYLGDDEFKEDMTQLDATMVLSILSHIEQIDSIYQLLDIYVLNPGYKTWYATFIALLREFHYGFNDLESLMKEEELYVYITDTNKFFERVYHFSKKF